MSARKTHFYNEKENVHHVMLLMKEKKVFANVYITTFFPNTNL